MHFFVKSSPSIPHELPLRPEMQEKGQEIEPMEPPFKNVIISKLPN
jgi:hypothetical protein